jgi:hypothetical protein
VQLDADAFLAKPLEAKAFVGRVTQLLHHGPRNDSELHLVDHYESIDVDTPVSHIVLEQSESLSDHSGPGSSSDRIQDPQKGSRVANILAEEKVFIGQEVPLADLTEGVRLARDLHYIGGRAAERANDQPASQPERNRRGPRVDMDRVGGYFTTLVPPNGWLAVDPL